MFSSNLLFSGGFFQCNLSVSISSQPHSLKLLFLSSAINCLFLWIFLLRFASPECFIPYGSVLLSYSLFFTTRYTIKPTSSKRQLSEILLRGVYCCNTSIFDKTTDVASAISANPCYWPTCLFYKASGTSGQTIRSRRRREEAERQEGICRLVQAAGWEGKGHSSRQTVPSSGANHLVT